MTCQSLENIVMNLSFLWPTLLQTLTYYPLSSVSPLQQKAGRQMKGIIPLNTSAQQFHILQQVRNIPDEPNVVKKFKKFFRWNQGDTYLTEGY